MVPKRIINFLKKAKAKYEVVGHKTVFTAYDLANTLERKLSGVAKTVLVKAGSGFTLLVLPGDRRVDLKKVAKLLGAKRVEITTEKVLVTALKIRPGAITPFSELHKDIPVFVDRSLTRARKLLTGAGSFTESIQLTAKELVRLAQAKVADVAERPKRK